MTTHRETLEITFDFMDMVLSYDLPLSGERVLHLLDLIRKFGVKKVHASLMAWEDLEEVAA